MRVDADPVSSHTATRARPTPKSFRSDNRSHGRDRAFLRPPTRPPERYEFRNVLASHPPSGQSARVGSDDAGNLGRIRHLHIWACLISASGILAAGCTETTHGHHVAVRILDAAHLEMNAVPCPDGSMKVSVTETADDVAVLLTFNVNSEAKCAGIVRATLAAPLGSRSLTNADTGRPLVVIQDLRCTPPVSSKRCDGVTVGTDPG